MRAVRVGSLVLLGAWGAATVAALGAPATTAAQDAAAATAQPPSESRWRWASPLPQGNVLRSACVDGRGAIWAAGETGTLGRIGQDLRAWEPVAVRTTDHLLRVACCGDTVFAVGENGTVVRHGASGTAERTIAGRTQATLTGVACVGASGVAITSGTGDVWVSEDGREMVRRTAPHPVYAVTSVGTSLLVSGPNGVISSSPNLGGRWTTQRTGAHGNALAFARAGSDLVAVGTRGIVLHSSDGGARWSVVPSGLETDLFAATLAPNGEVVAVGAAGVATAARTGRELAPVLAGRFHDVIVAGSRTIALGAAGRLAVRRGRGPFVVAPRWEPSLWGTWWDAATRIVVGDRGFLALARGSNAAEPRVVPVPTVAALHAVTGNARGIVLAVGAEGTILRSTDRGRRWTRVVVPARDAFNAVWLDDDGHALCVGGRGQRYRSDDGGRTWDGSTALGRDHQLTAIASSGSTLWVVGSGGRLERSDDHGRTWRGETPPPTSGDLRAVHVTARGAMLVVTRPGTVTRRDESGQWRTTLTYDAALVSGISGDAERILLVTADGATFESRDDGITWNPERPITREVLTSVRVGFGRAYATGYWGTLLVR